RTVSERLSTGAVPVSLEQQPHGLSPWLDCAYHRVEGWHDSCRNRSTRWTVGALGTAPPVPVAPTSHAARFSALPPMIPDMTEFVLTSELPAQRRRSLVGDLREIAVDELWKYRELLYQLMLRDVRIRYKQAVMGFAWAILMPALIVAAGTLVRFAMAYVGGGHVSHDAIAGMAVKALPWAFFVGAIGFATSSLTGNLPLVSKIYFPREVLPLSATCAQSFDSTIGAITVAI